MGIHGNTAKSSNEWPSVMQSTFSKNQTNHIPGFFEDFQGLNLQLLNSSSFSDFQGPRGTLLSVEFAFALLLTLPEYFSSMQSSKTVERPSVPSIDSNNGGRRVCC